MGRAPSRTRDGSKAPPGAHAAGHALRSASEPRTQTLGRAPRRTAKPPRSTPGGREAKGQSYGRGRNPPGAPPPPTRANSAPRGAPGGRGPRSPRQGRSDTTRRTGSARVRLGPQRPIARRQARPTPAFPRTHRRRRGPGAVDSDNASAAARRRCAGAGARALPQGGHATLLATPARRTAQPARLSLRAGSLSAIPGRDLGPWSTPGRVVRPWLRSTQAPRTPRAENHTLAAAVAPERAGPGRRGPRRPRARPAPRPSPRPGAATRRGQAPRSERAGRAGPLGAPLARRVWLSLRKGAARGTDRPGPARGPLRPPAASQACGAPAALAPAGPSLPPPLPPPLAGISLPTLPGPKKTRVIAG